MGLFLKIIRYKEWYDSKWNIYFFIFLLFCCRHPELNWGYYLKGLVAVMSFSFFLLAFGYSFNDFSDANEDQIAGKPNQMAHFSLSRQITILTTISSLCFIIPVCLFPCYGMVVIVLISLLMAFLYSYRLLGIKQCGFWGLIVSSLAQRVCPLFAIFFIFHDWTSTSFMVALLSFIVGLRWILVHQSEDKSNDNVSNTHSFVVSLGNNTSKLLLIITAVFICELICLFIIIVQNARLSFSLVVPLVYLLFQLIILPFWVKVGWKRMILSYDFAPLSDFYYLWVGVYIVTALTIHSFTNVVMLVPVLYFGYRYIVLDYKYIKLNSLANRGLLLPPDQKETIND